MKPKKRYYHEVSERELKKLFAKRTTYRMLKSLYNKPDWCEMADAMHPFRGCWSLTLSSRKLISKEYCRSCDLYRGKV